jgi:hypothetical protein
MFVEGCGPNQSLLSFEASGCHEGTMVVGCAHYGEAHIVHQIRILRDTRIQAPLAICKMLVACPGPRRKT